MIPRYCWSCGTKLRQKLYYTGRYDTETGKAYRLPELTCPNKKWYEFWHVRWPGIE